MKEKMECMRLVFSASTYIGSITVSDERNFVTQMLPKNKKATNSTIFYLL